MALSLSSTTTNNSLPLPSSSSLTSTQPLPPPPQQQQQQQHHQNGISDAQLRPLARATQIIRAHMNDDANWPDLADHLSAAQYAYKLHLIPPWAPLAKKRSLSIPTTVIEASTSAETHAAQGLFTEIERAWIVIDTSLYLWDYLDSSSDAFEFYDHRERVIRSVGLVKPKPGVFIDAIKYVLVIATNASLSLLGVECIPVPQNRDALLPAGGGAPTPSRNAGGPSASSSLQIRLHVPNMTVNTDGVIMQDIQGTDAGRLFCRGSDGCLYEVCYQAEEGWFSSRCFLRNVTAPRFASLVPSFMQARSKETLTRICVDPTRSVLYALHKQSEIELFALPSTDSSQAPRFVARTRDVCRQANMICPNTTALQAATFAITCMSAVSPAESRNVHLVAVTSTGCRLYFTHSRGGLRGLGGYSMGASSTSGHASTPTCIELVYVRPPPPAGLQQTTEGALAGVVAPPPPPPQQQQYNERGGGVTSASTSVAGFAATAAAVAAAATAGDAPPQQPLVGGIQTALYADGVFLAAGPYAMEATGTIDNVLGVLRALPSASSSSAASTTTGMSGASAATAAMAAPGGGASGVHLELSDTATDVLVRGSTWALGEVPRRASAAAVGGGTGRLSPLARQVVSPARAFLVLTSAGLDVLTEVTPMETLRGLLETNAVYDQTVHEFFKRFGQAQACAMTLAIASRNQQLLVAPESLLASNASAELAPRALSDDVVSHAWRIFFDFGGHPKYEPPPYPSMPASEGRVTLSGRHAGLALYLARLLRPIWNDKVAKRIVATRLEPERIETAVTTEALTHAQTDLVSLNRFVQRHAQWFGAGSSTSVATKGGAAAGAPASSGGLVTQATSSAYSSEGEQLAWREEQESFEALRALLARSLEAVSFVMLLNDYKLPTLAARCTAELRTQLLGLTFGDVVATTQGRDVARALVEAIIDAQIAAEVSIDAVAEVLQERCGSFCNADDVRLYKALECIRRARQQQQQQQQQMGANGVDADSAERSQTEYLRESLRLLHRAAAQLPLAKLEEVCRDYRQLGFVSGALDLPLRCAETWDPTHLARAYRAEGMPANDARRAVYERNSRCYQLVLDTLQGLYDAEPGVTPSPSGGTGGGGGVSADAGVVAKQEAYRALEAQRDNAYRQVQASSDPLFHVALYDWLLARDGTEELLRMQTPFIQDYLLSEPATLQRSLLLCRWYVNMRMPLAAAKVYEGLAHAADLGLTLFDRVEYLSLAASNARSAATAAAGGGGAEGSNEVRYDLVDFTAGVEEQLEVAQVQIEVYHYLEQASVDTLDAEEKAARLAELDAALLDVSSLYRDFAEPYCMWEVKLRILHVSDHGDAALVQEAWDMLLDEAHREPNRPRHKRFEGVAATVIDVGRRFVDSDVAFPIGMLVDSLERYAFLSRHDQEIPAGWAPLTLLSAGAPAELVYDELESAWQARREPWQTHVGALFLLSDVAALVEFWTREHLGGSASAAAVAEVGLGRGGADGLGGVGVGADDDGQVDVDGVGAGRGGGVGWSARGSVGLAGDALAMASASTAGYFPAKRLDDAISSLLASLVPLSTTAAAQGGGGGGGGGGGVGASELGLARGREKETTVQKLKRAQDGYIRRLF